MDRKSQQNLFLVVGVLGVIALFFVVFVVLAPKQVATAATNNETARAIETSIIADRTSAAAPEMSWITRSRAEIEDLRSLTEDLKSEIAAERQGRAQAISEVHEEYASVIEQQILKIEALEVAVAERPTLAAPPIGSSQEAVGPDFSATGSEFIRTRTAVPQNATPFAPRTANATPDPTGQSAVPARPTDAGLRSFGRDFQLSEREAEPEPASVNTLHNYIPAGSYAPAVVLSGADAATNVINRENPIPVLFRISGPAVTAGVGLGPGARVNITGCTVQGSAIGDLSSERVLVRLLTLTCIRRDGSIMETEIAGYMTGSGKAGVRGRVVSREGNLVTNAGIAGALQGLAGAVTGTGTGEEGIEDVASIAQAAGAAAAAGGVQKAATTLSEYYINRAEQYQPVISLNGGTRVEIVFLEGVSLQ